MGRGAWAVREGESCPPFPHHSPVQAGWWSWRPAGTQGSEHQPCEQPPPGKTHRAGRLGWGLLHHVWADRGTTSLRGAPRKCSTLILSLPGSVTVSGLFLVWTQLRAALCEISLFCMSGMPCDSSVGAGAGTKSQCGV